MANNYPRLVVAGLSGDSGKTITSLSLLTALRQKGVSLSVFKKGPDYIDAAWLSAASASTCRNLDTYMVPRDRVLAGFVRHSAGSDLALIEGNRGLFDGKDAHGTHSTAELARLLDAPVVLVVDCTKTTRTVAAMVEGCRALDPKLKLAGVVLNRVAGPRHIKVITEAIEEICRLPVLGAIPKLGADASLIPGRHLGLVTPAEFKGGSELEVRLAEIATKYLDVERIQAIARAASPLPQAVKRPSTRPPEVRIGYFRDSVFTFYYPENLEALAAEGAELTGVSSLNDTSLGEIDALYIGGGFPETHAEQLSANNSLRKAVREAIEHGLPVYAECGGLIFLCRELQVDEQSYPMAGVFDLALRMNKRPVGHGYVELSIAADNPFLATGTVIRGHEFHYSGAVDAIPEGTTCMLVTTGVGLGGGRDGLLRNHCLACYTHLHADGVPAWASSMVRAAREYRERRISEKKSADGDAEAIPRAAVA